MIYSWDNARSLVGLLLCIGICWALSENRARFPIKLALGALALQAGLVLLLFAFPPARFVLNGLNSLVDGLTSATEHGTQFVFGYLAGGAPPYAPADGAPGSFIFAFRVLPLILVISALSSLLWHWRILEWIVRGFGLVFERTMGLGGASALAVAANIFMGMIESPLVIRAYLEKLSRSEMFLMMVVGLATVAGSTMVAYALILAPVLPNAAAHVLVASIISAPAGVLLARIMIPEAPDAAPPDYHTTLRYEGSMDAIMRGVQDGLSIVVNVAASLIVFVAFVWLVNNMLALSPPIGGEAVTLQRIFAYVFAPVAYLIGVPWQDALIAGDVLGVKLFLTEFAAFLDLAALPADAISERSRMILTYALCGFANVASVGIMAGGLIALMPARRSEILDLSWKSLLPGYLATLMTASIVAAMPAGLF